MLCQLNYTRLGQVGPSMWYFGTEPLWFCVSISRQAHFSAVCQLWMYCRSISVRVHNTDTATAVLRWGGGAAFPCRWNCLFLGKALGGRSWSRTLNSSKSHFYSILKVSQWNIGHGRNLTDLPFHNEFRFLCVFLRRDMLEEHKLLHMFLSDYDDLVFWLQDLLQHLKSDDLPQNVKASEESLGVHQERRV